jgi:hypothetical protein
MVSMNTPYWYRLNPSGAVYSKHIWKFSVANKKCHVTFGFENLEQHIHKQLQWMTLYSGYCKVMRQRVQLMVAHMPKVCQGCYLGQIDELVLALAICNWKLLRVWSLWWLVCLPMVLYYWLASIVYQIAILFKTFLMSHCTFELKCNFMKMQMH